MKHVESIVTVTISPYAREVPLPAELAEHAGRRVLVTTAAGDVFPPSAIELRSDGAPFVPLPWTADGRVPTTASVRWGEPHEPREIVTSTHWRCERCGGARYLLIERGEERLSWCIRCYDEVGHAR